jgi:hypothetical protein|tara:strand:+ start:202 stop:720 length:519 start_codon:yes stop_codon:yes gene_type:complete
MKENERLEMIEIWKEFNCQSCDGLENKSCCDEDGLREEQIESCVEMFIDDNFKKFKKIEFNDYKCMSLDEFIGNNKEILVAEFIDNYNSKWKEFCKINLEILLNKENKENLVAEFIDNYNSKWKEFCKCRFKESREKLFLKGFDEELKFEATKDDNEELKDYGILKNYGVLD